MCNHKYECGCEKQICLNCVLAKDDFCENEDCKCYYEHRNDKCDCDGDCCGYCNPKEEEEEERECVWCEKCQDILEYDGDRLCGSAHLDNGDIVMLCRACEKQPKCATEGCLKKAHPKDIGYWDYCDDCFNEDQDE